jgi:hypothetical protein
VQLVGVLLVPFQAGLLAEYANAQPLADAAGDHAGPQLAPGAADEAQVDVGIVVGLAAGNHGAEVGRHRFKLQTGDGAHQVMGMRADVAQHR